MEKGSGNLVPEDLRVNVYTCGWSLEVSTLQVHSQGLN